MEQEDFLTQANAPLQQSQHETKELSDAKSVPMGSDENLSYQPPLVSGTGQMASEEDSALQQHQDFATLAVQATDSGLVTKEEIQLVLNNSKRSSKVLQEMALKAKREDHDGEDGWRAMTESNDTTVNNAGIAQFSPRLSTNSQPPTQLSTPNSERMSASGQKGKAAIIVGEANRRMSEHIQPKNGEQIGALAIAQAYHAGQQKDSTKLIGQKESYSEDDDNDMETYKNGLLPQQDLQQQLYHQQLNRQSEQQRQGWQDDATSSQQAETLAHNKKEMERAHVHQEFAKRPENDNRLIFKLMISLVVVILLIIAWRTWVFVNNSNHPSTTS